MSKDKQTYPICDKCKQERKPIKFNGTINRECACGVSTKDGKLLLAY